ASAVALESQDAAHLARILREVSQGARKLAGLLGGNEDTVVARRQLVQIAQQLDPQAISGWPMQTENALLRSRAVDLLQITGYTGDQARAQLAEPGSLGTSDR